jgi:membrane protein YdbS with pleckstrin-like domain
MRLIITFIAFLFMISSAGVVWLISHDSTMPPGDVMVVYWSTVILNLLWYVPGMLLAGTYYHSLSYEVEEDEVIVRAGIWTHSVKHVPYRTVTNMTIKRGILDRWFFGLGSLHIQTAGMSGTPGAEEVLEGLSNVQEVYAIVVGELQRYRAPMVPAGAEGEAEATVGGASTQNLDAILTELRAIRQALEAG